MPTHPLPKFLLCDPDDSDPESVVAYVLHIHEPACLIRFTEEADGSCSGEPVKWFTDQPTFIQQQLDAGIEPALTLARLMRQAGDFLRETL
jgi:hypothetical protein